MTHQPPIPGAATPPYPLHPAPIPEAVKLAHAAEAAEREAQEQAGVSTTAIGIGTAIAVGAAAAVTGILYARRRSADSARTTGKTKRGGDDKAKRGAADRSRVAAGEAYEVTYFARKHGITAAEARAIIKEAGPDRKAANALATQRKNRSVGSGSA